MNKQDIGLRAKRLRENISEVLEAIRQDQVKVFLNTAATQDDREEAHNMVRALSKIEAELKRRIDAATFEQHKER